LRGTLWWEGKIAKKRRIPLQKLKEKNRFLIEGEKITFAAA